MTLLDLSRYRMLFLVALIQVGFAGRLDASQAESLFRKSIVQPRTCGIGTTFSTEEPAPHGLLPVLGEKVAKPNEGAFPNAMAIEDPSPYPLPEYRERAVILSSRFSKLRTAYRSRVSGAFGADSERVGERLTAAAIERPADPELVPVPVPEPSAKALRFHRGNNLLWAIDEVWALIVPGFVAFSGLSARIRNLAQRLGRNRFFTIGIYVILFLCLIFLIELPLSYYQGYVRLREYGLSNQTSAKWLKNGLIGLGVASIVGFCFTWVPYLLLERSPRRWWLYTSILVIPFLLAGMLVMPIWIDPLFNDFGPMKNKALESSILALAEKANIQGSRVFEVDKRVDTNAVNAYVTGFLASKRIVLWDTLIAKLDEKELLCVMAHEMGHYALGHVVRSILLSSLVVLVGLYLVDRMGRILIARFSRLLQFDTLSDVASIPLMMMLIQVNSLILSPAVLAYSRYQEHQADRYALDLTHANHSAGMAFAKLQEENLGVPRPSWFYRVFRSTHPSIGERIDFCNSYRPWTQEVASGTVK